METTQQQPPLAAPEKQKHRSGYSRIRNRHHHLIAEHEALKADHQKLTRQHEALKAGHAELQAAFDELLCIHNGLLGRPKAIASGAFDRILSRLDEGSSWLRKISTLAKPLIQPKASKMPLWAKWLG